MSSPFDDVDGEFVVLRNAEQQRSLWPSFAAVPDGWSVEYGPDGRQACLERVERAPAEASAGAAAGGAR